LPDFGLDRCYYVGGRARVMRLRRGRGWLGHDGHVSRCER
jgi:hypothetical protein